MKKFAKKILVGNIILVSLLALLSFIQYCNINIDSVFYLILRWATVGTIILYAFATKKITAWIVAAMVAGIVCGYDFQQNEFVIALEKLSKIFVRLIKTIIAPLIFSTLVVGIAGHSNLKQVGRMGLKAIIYFEIVTTLALFIGLGAINFTEAGVGVHVKANENTVKKATDIINNKKEADHLLEVFPENIALAVAENKILQVVIFSLLFAMGLALVKNNSKQIMLNGCQALADVMFKVTDIVMYVAPLAVFGALASTVSKNGVGVLMDLAKLVGTLYGALIVFVILVFIPILILIKADLKKFWAAIREPVSLAFATASSEAALPKAMENMNKYGVPQHVVSFVMPTGYSFNLDGTTLYLSMASVFVAQMCGVDLTIGQQATMCLTLMLTSKGVAGVRGASFIVLLGTITAMGLDQEKAFLILAVDAFMDMARTAVNVTGNCIATIVVAKWEKEI